MPETTLAFFDFDNTLYKGTSRYIILDFSTFLADRSLFPSSQFHELKHLFKSYFAGTLTRHDFGVQVVETFYKGLEGHGEKEINDLAMDFIKDKDKANWFPYTLPLLKMVKPFSRSLLVSGSPKEILEPINHFLGLDEVHASEGIIENGSFTGQTNRELATASAKQEFMRSLAKSRPFDPLYCLAFGDSESDFPLLQSVAPENAFLVTNNEKLRKITEEHSWSFIAQEGPVVETVQERIKTLFHS